VPNVVIAEWRFNTAHSNASQPTAFGGG